MFMKHYFSRNRNRQTGHHQLVSTFPSALPNACIMLEKRGICFLQALPDGTFDIGIRFKVMATKAILRWIKETDRIRLSEICAVE